MKALIIYESMYGNTEIIANAIGEGLSEHMPADVVEVGVAPREVPGNVDLLVIGAPTHQFGMSRRSSREQAAKETHGRLVSSAIGVREWLDAEPRSSDSVAAAAFCTLLEKPRLLRYAGTAARSIEKRLTRLGFRIAVNGEIFWVTSSIGPLIDGEEARARQWGAALGSRVAMAKREPVTR